METKKEEAIVLRVRRFGESDAIISLFTKGEGRLSAIAKGGLKSQKRFGGALEIGAWIDLVYERRAHRDLFLLKESSRLDFANKWRLSWKTITVGSFALELALKLLPEHQSASNKFELLRHFLQNLEESDAAEKILEFQLQWLALSGWEADLETCGLCGQKVSGPIQKTLDHYWGHILSKPLLSRRLLGEALLV